MLTKMQAFTAGLLVLAPLSAAPPQVPNFSGHWVLATATATGGGWTSGGAVAYATVERPTTRHTTIGAAFNCGRECTIGHEGETLSIQNAILAGRAEPAPTVMLQLSGRRTLPVLGQFVPVTAAWNAERLDIVTESAPRGYSQSLSFAGTQLVVMTSDVHVTSRLTLKYNKGRR